MLLNVSRILLAVSVILAFSADPAAAQSDTTDLENIDEGSHLFGQRERSVEVERIQSHLNLW